MNSVHKLFVILTSLPQGQGQYHKSIKAIEDDIQKAIKQVNELTGIKESDTGLAAPALWDLAADKQTLQNEQPLQVCAMHSVHPSIFLYKLNPIILGGSVH